jgi:ACT domain-containing protein
MKKNRVKDAFLEQLRKIPIVAVAAEKVGISRNSVYKWRNADEAFRDEMEAALAEGEALVNDMGESQLLSLIQEKNWPAISFWLRHRNPKFRERVEVTATVQAQEALTPEQEDIVRRALRLASLDNHDQPAEKPGQPDAGHRDGDAQGPQS